MNMNEDLGRQTRSQLGCLQIGGKLHRLYKGLNTLGRNKTATVIIKDMNISQNHAIITIVDEHQHFVSDLHSANGTSVGGSKLQSFELCEVFHNSVVVFANTRAIYKKFPSTLHTDNICNETNTQTQELENSFYTASTQAIQAPAEIIARTSTNLPSPGYFDDDYNDTLSEIEIPIVTGSNKSTQGKTASKKLTVNEMPTQILSDDVTNTSTANTQIEHENETRAYVDIHDVATQIIFSAVSTGKVNTSNMQDDNLNDEITQRDTIHYKPTQYVHEPSIHDAETQIEIVTNEPTKITNTTPCSAYYTNSAAPVSPSLNKNGDVCVDHAANVTGLVFDDSGLDVTGQENTGIGNEVVKRTTEIVNLSQADSASPLHVSQLRHRSRIPILDDSDDENINSESDLLRLNMKNTKLTSESSENTESDEIGRIKKKCKKIESDESGSETDIDEDLISKTPDEHDANLSCKDGANVQANNKSVMVQKSDENYGRESTLNQSHPENDQVLDDTDHITESDNDDDLQFKPVSNSTYIDQKNVQEQNKPNTQDNCHKPKTLVKDKLMASQHCSEDSFHFQLSGFTEDSEITAKQTEVCAITSTNDNTDLNEEDDDGDKTPDILDIEEHPEIFDGPTQKLNTAPSNILERNVKDDSKISLNNETRQKSFKNQKEEIKNISASNDEFFLQPTQHIVEHEKTHPDDDTFKQPGQFIQSKHSSSDISTIDTSIFDQSPQLFSESEKKTTDLCIQPTLGHIDNNLANDSLLFNQATQKLITDQDIGSSDGDTKIKLHKTPNQKLSSTDNSKPATIVHEEDMFNQPTQIMLLSEKAVEPNDDVFLQPTQEIMEPAENKSFNQTARKLRTHQSILLNSNQDDIFIEPTQRLTAIDHSKADKVINERDMFDEPTQKIMEHAGIKSVEDSMFDQPTQKLGTNQDISLNASDQDCTFIESTPKLTPMGHSKADRIIDEGEVFDEPTQIVPINNDDVHQATHEIIKHAENKSVDDSMLFDQPTQKLATNQDISLKASDQDCTFIESTQKLTPIGHSKADRIIDEGEVFDEPTQIVPINNDDVHQATHEIIKLTENKSVEDGMLFDQPTQKLATNQDISLNASDQDCIFIEPTQKSTAIDKSAKTIDEDIFIQSTQIFHTNNDLVVSNDECLQPNEKIINAANETSSSSQIIENKYLSLRKSPNKANKVEEDESQLEVTFSTQTLHLSSEINTRPTNPLVNYLDANKKGGDNDLGDNRNLDGLDDDKLQCSESMENYCDQPTLPISEIEDFQLNNQPNDANTQNKKIVGRPPKKDLRKETLPATPRRSDRKSKVEIQKISIGDTPPKEFFDVASSPENNKFMLKPIAGKMTNETKISMDETRSGRSLRNKKSVENINEKKDSKEQRNEKKGRKHKLPIITDSSDTEEERKLQIVETKQTMNNKSKNSNKRNKNEIQEDMKTPSKKIQRPQIIAPSIKSTTEAAQSIAGTSCSLRSKRVYSNDSKLPSDCVEISSDSSPSPTKHRKLDVGKKPQTLRNDKLQNSTSDSTTDQSGSNKTKPRNPRKNSVSKSTSPPSSTSSSGRSLIEDTEVVQTRTRGDKSRKGEETTIISATSNATNKQLDVSIGTSDVRKEDEETEVVQKRTRGGKSRKGEETKIISARSNATTKQLDVSISIPDLRKEDADTEVVPKKTRGGKSRRGEETTTISATNNATNNQVDVSIGTPDLRKEDQDTEVVQKRTRGGKSRRGEETKIISSTSNATNKHLDVSISTPDRTKRKQKPKVVFTMLDSPELETLIRRLGGTVVDTVNACTVLVTGSLKRSTKLLSAVGQAKPICSPTWLEESKKANAFLDPWDFLLQDDEAENKWDFSLRESLNRSQNTKLLRKFTILLVVSDALDVLKGAIESCGGKWIIKAPRKIQEINNFIVVGNPNKKTSYSKFLTQKPPVTVVAPEAIFDGVLRQEIHWNDHLLL